MTRLSVDYFVESVQHVEYTVAQQILSAFSNTMVLSSYFQAECSFGTLVSLIFLYLFSDWSNNTLQTFESQRQSSNRFISLASNRAELYKAELIRQPYTGQMGDNNANTFSQGLEPEYVTFDPQVPVAYISLQVRMAQGAFHEPYCQ